MKRLLEIKKVSVKKNMILWLTRMIMFRITIWSNGRMKFYLMMLKGKKNLDIGWGKQTGNVAIFIKLGFKVIKENKEDSILAENLTDEELIDVYMERMIK